LNPRTVHGLRVACRRLRAAVKVFGKRRLRKLDARIERLQDSLGDLRDLQLHARWIARHGGDRGNVRERLAAAEAHLRRALALWTRRSEPLLLRELPHVHGRGTLGGKRARKRLRKRVRQLEKALSQRRPLEPAAAHRIRLAAKKLRYEGELLRDGFRVDGALKALAAAQSALGDLHDSDVRLREFGRDRRLARAARQERIRATTAARGALRRVKRACAELDERL
jgi:triphosphatase